MCRRLLDYRGVIPGPYRIGPSPFGNVASDHDRSVVAELHEVTLMAGPDAEVDGQRRVATLNTETLAGAHTGERPVQK
jgi:hypothetical protein